MARGAVIALAACIFGGCSGAPSTSPWAPDSDAPPAQLEAVPTTSDEPDRIEAEEPPPAPADEGDFLAWRNAMSQICSITTPEAVELQARLGVPETLADLVELFAALQPMNERYVEAVGALAVPTEHRAEIERVNELNIEMDATVSAVLDAARRDDVIIANSHLVRMENQIEEMEALLGLLGLPECYEPPDDTG